MNLKKSRHEPATRIFVPADLVDKYPEFFWSSVSMHLDEGIKYLNLTVSSHHTRNLHHHLLCAESPSV